MYRLCGQWKNDGNFYESIEFASFVTPNNTCDFRKPKQKGGKNHKFTYTPFVPYDG